MERSNIEELAQIAREVGANVIEGKVSYPSITGGWQIGDLDFCESLEQYRDRRVVVIIADCGADDQAETYTCGICGFVMNELGECPRCKMEIAMRAGKLE